MGAIYYFSKPKTTLIIDGNFIVFQRGAHDMTITKRMRGETRISIKQIIGIKFKEPTLFSRGYLQFSTPRTGIHGLARTVDQPENAISFGKEQLQEVIELKSYIESLI